MARAVIRNVPLFFHDSVVAGEDHFGGEREAKRKGSLSFECHVGSLVHWSND